ncbi:hypothetical protein L6250_01900 [Candidatus Parcubacteria bacterium]|nr:hypothetical protein [Patescibacteria group bacterium]MBU4466796.1 hypothetical protein [Patescibacteria group bacterium]MCG2688368.1 hypothetical protein [Candidatus Parcubacteria bacterium]
MNKESKPKQFSVFLERKINARRIEPKLEKTKLSFKEIVITIGVVLGAILGTLIMAAFLISIVTGIIYGLKTLIRILQS